MNKTIRSIHLARAERVSAALRSRADAADAAAGPAPGDVSPGADHTRPPATRPPEGQYIGLDWFRATGPASQAERVAELLDGVFGAESTPRGGRYNFREGREWACSAATYCTHTSKRVRIAPNPDINDPNPWLYGDGSHLMCVDIPGGAMNMLGGEQQVELVRRITRMGFRATRLDVYLDVVGPGAANLIDNAYESCEQGELCGARRFGPLKGSDFLVNTQSDYRLVRRVAECVGKGLSIGKRGKEGSGRYCRIYDKGLETKLAREGEWVRFEVEFTSDCAVDATLAILELHVPETERSGDDDTSGGTWADAALGVLLGSFDFRQNNGATNLAKRPRRAWWAALVEGVELMRVTAGRTEKTLAGKLRWTALAVLPWLDRLAAELGGTIDAAAAQLFGPDRQMARADLAVCELRLRRLLSPV